MQSVRLLLIILLFFISIVCLKASTYYISSSTGSDNRTAAEARSEHTPWQSIEKLNSIIGSLSPGDKVLFKRGDTFYGSIRINKQNNSINAIEFGAYGSGEKPVITSFVEIKNWLNIGNGVFEADLSQINTDAINVLTINGTPHAIGRYPNFEDPNKGYLRIEQIGSNSLTSSELGGSPNFNGAEVVIRKNAWIIDRHPITQHSGNQINYGSAHTQYTASRNYGFFIQNHRNTLDIFGEWFYDKNSKKLYVHFGNSNPSSLSVKVSTLTDLVNLNWEVGNYSFNNLKFEGANESAIHIRGGKNVKILNSEFQFIREAAIHGILSSNLEIENCKFNYSFNNAIFINNASENVKIRNNEILNTFTFNGMGKNSSLNGQAIYLTSNAHNGLIEGNTIKNIGYVGINFGGNNTIVKNNYIDNFCMHKTDGGGIYTWEGPSNRSLTNRVIEGNIIINGLGYKEGTVIQGAINNPAVEGIYLDDNTAGILIKNNTIANVANSGIYVHNARNIVIDHNMMFNNSDHIFFSDDNLGAAIQNVKVENNTFFSKHPDQYFLKFSSTSSNTFESMASFSNNAFASPYGTSAGIFRQRVSSGATPELIKTLEEWGQDRSYKFSNQKLDLIKSYEFSGQNLFRNSGFNQNAEFTHCQNCSLQRLTGGEFEGGYIRYRLGRTGRILFNIGKPDINQDYILKFTAKANKKAKLELIIRQDGSPWSSLIKPYVIEIEEEKKTYEFAFRNLINIEKAVVTLASIVDDLEIFIDDVVVQSAQIAFDNDQQPIIFDYNFSSSTKKLPIPGLYHDARDYPYKSQVDIPAFFSTALVRVEAEEITEDTPPVIKITSPENNFEVYVNDKIEILKDIELGSNELQKVELFKDQTLIHTFEEEPFRLEYYFEEEGEYILTAKATDKKGLESESDPITIKVSKSVDPINLTWNSPEYGDFFFALEPVLLAISANGEDERLVKIDFLINNTIFSTVTEPLFETIIQDLDLGTHLIQAIAYDIHGNKFESEPLSISIVNKPNESPTISIITPEDQQVFEQGQVIEITTLSADEDGEVVKVDFYADDILIASVEAEPFTFNWDNAPLGNHYITAIATDNEGAATVSTPIYITIEEAPAVNVSPTISIITPADQQIFEQGQVIEITTLSADEDGEVVKVDFYAGDLLIASVEAEPFNFNWDNAPLGNHYITAIATDNEGAATVSTPIFITIEEAPASNVSPTISIITPEDQQVFEQGQVIEITTLSADEDGEVVKVDFYVGDLLIASVEAEPFTFNWDNAPLGNHYITAIATDNEGAATVSTPIYITVEEAPAANVSPTISIITPEDQQVFEQGQVIEITTLSADEDGEVVKVDFYADDLLIASVEAEPFTFNWDNAPLGNHYITAIATDNEGAATVSNSVYITVEEAPAVNVSPTISIITPEDQQVFEQGQVIEITTLSADEDGEVVKVDFYADDLLIANVEAEPFTFNWDNAPLGNHYITAIATDNEGAATVSTPIFITVEEAPEAPAVNVSPTISIITPTDQQVFEQGQVIEITTLSADEDGEVVKVDFYADDLLIASVEAEPFTFNWDNAPLGNHYITAIATDNEGAATVSTPIYITVEEAPAVNVSPTISIITPTDQQVFEQGQVIEITTLSADEDGEVVKVDFYAGDLLIASVEVEPFTFNWDNAPLGNHYITAIATDNEGAATVSNSVYITVEEAPEIPETPEAPAANVSPTISIITPEDQQVFEQGQVIEITTLSADEDGEVMKVDFYADDLLIASVEAEPFTFNWDNAPLGNHYITAIATDNEGA
ncbi:Ig-like domain-containing protein, partial [Belliella kenyensis]